MTSSETAVASREVPAYLEFSFTGRALEYFGIWIVNLFLSIITLGIYTAWAKVRRLRYFYGNTWLDGHNFEYHARPVSILIGRIIVVSLLIAYNLLVSVSPFFGLLIFLYLLAFPWLLNKSMSFNARMTSYRNVRLNFRGSYWGALLAFVIMPVVALLTAGLLFPLASKLSNDYIGRHLGYGSARFETRAPLKALYGNLGSTILFVIMVTLVCAGIGFVIGSSMVSVGNMIEKGGDELLDVLTFGPITGALIGGYIALAVAYLFYAAGVRNVAYNHTVLDGKHRLTSSVGRLRYVWILVSNLFATILTLGLLRPWAAVRTWRYLASSTGLLAAGSLDHFVDEAAPEGSVGAAEFFDIEGIDFGL
ncbi:YjgN family protein [uncultured Nitratireductor sp.]|uniref:YjgN family protein n=1 Tax=uncultured Nitratireductor sp. TaxID=520953 RepID=UPI0025E36B8D|nr:YjgN family protein [uncultured Nitratireductor sp.]